MPSACPRRRDGFVSLCLSQLPKCRPWVDAGDSRLPDDVRRCPKPVGKEVSMVPHCDAAARPRGARAKRRNGDDAAVMTIGIVDVVPRRNRSPGEALPPCGRNAYHQWGDKQPESFPWHVSMPLSAILRTTRIKEKSSYCLDVAFVDREKEGKADTTLN